MVHLIGIFAEQNVLLLNENLYQWRLQSGALRVWCDGGGVGSGLNRRTCTVHAVKFGALHASRQTFGFVYIGLSVAE